MPRSSISRRGLTAAALALPALLARASQAQNSSYPTRPVRLLLGFPAGGSTDIIARLVADKLGARLGQAVVVENRPGAGAMIAAEAVTRSAPDGHTLMFSSSTLIISAVTMRNPPVNIMRDLVPVNNLVEAPMLLIGSRNAPFSTLEEMLAYARANPGKLNIAVPGAGSSNHLGVELLIRQANIDVTVVPYQGNAPQLTALVRGDVPMATDSIATSMGFINDGTVRPLAVTGARRSALLPNVPTVAEAAGLPEYVTSFWFGILAPAAMPNPILDRLQRETAAVMAQPEVLTFIRAQGFEPVAFGAEQFGQRMTSDLDQLGRIARQAGLIGQ